MVGRIDENQGVAVGENSATINLRKRNLQLNIHFDEVVDKRGNAFEFYSDGELVGVAHMSQEDFEVENMLTVENEDSFVDVGISQEFAEEIAEKVSENMFH